MQLGGKLFIKEGGSLKRSSRVLEEVRHGWSPHPKMRKQKQPTGTTAP